MSPALAMEARYLLILAISRWHPRSHYRCFSSAI